MKEKIFDRIRKSKPFEIKDIFIYGMALLIVIGLFLSLLGFNKTNDISGYKITVKNEIAVTLSFTDGVMVDPAFNELVLVKQGGNVFTITVYTKDKSGFNEIIFNLAEKSVFVSKSNCSESKDCTHFPKLTNSGSIYCAPHQLKISPLNDGYKNPVAGEI